MTHDLPIGSNAKLTITLENAGGVLDRRDASDGEIAISVLLGMVKEMPFLRPSDVFRVHENAGRRA